MKSTLSFALRRKFAWDEVIRECQTHSLVIANIEDLCRKMQNTRNSTKWSVKKLKEWQSARSNKVAANETLGFHYGKVYEVQDLTVDIAQMSPLSLNVSMTKFVGEIRNRSGDRYTPRSLYQIVCAIKRYMSAT